ncbi:MAG: polyprenyl synthetase family protein [Bacteroidales bacterium]|nr:polyprenyl synthetase family protein [Bacteroidales bacterium]
MDLGTVRQYLRPSLAEVEACISHYLRSDVALLDQTNRSLREHGGKLMRPMLVLLSAGALGNAGPDTIRIAAAAEMMHNATLLHDDVVDQAGERRGLPTLFSLLGGGPAVLVGDFWLVRGLQAVMDVEHEGLQVLRLCEKTLSDLAEGELLQMQKASAGDTTLDDYLRIIYCKTASLFETSARCGALSAGASQEDVDRMGRFAKLVGLAFQMKDDIFDYGEPAAALGKPVGIDLKEGKITLPLLCALDMVSPEEARSIREQVVRVAEEPALEASVRAFVRAQDGVARAQVYMESLIREAVDLLEPLPQTQEKDFLGLWARYVGARNV